MKRFWPKKTFAHGVALAIPLVIVIFVFNRLILFFERLIAPAAAKMGIDKFLGKLTLSILATLLILLVILLLGLLMRIRVVSALRKKLQDIFLYFIPSFQFLKVMAEDTLDLETSLHAWQPVLLFFGNKYNAGFIVEEDDDLITLFIARDTTLRVGEIMVTQKKNVSTIPVDYTELRKFSRLFGKGYISLIKGDSTKRPIVNI